MASAKGIGLIIGGGAIAALLLFSKKSKAGGLFSSEKRVNINPDTKIGKFFQWKEFVRSSVFPEMANYKPTESELAHTRNVVKKILDPIRAAFGPTVVSGGGRPASVAAAHGTTWYDLLKSRGLSPAKNSDHDTFDAFDIKPTKVSGIAGWQKVVQFLRKLIKTGNIRQSMVYFTRAADGLVKISHIHLAATRPGKPQVVPERRLLFVLDGKAVATPKEFKTLQVEPESVQLFT